MIVFDNGAVTVGATRMRAAAESSRHFREVVLLTPTASIAPPGVTVGAGRMLFRHRLDAPARAPVTVRLWAFREEGVVQHLSGRLPTWRTIDAMLSSSRNKLSRYGECCTRRVGRRPIKPCNFAHTSQICSPSFQSCKPFQVSTIVIP